MNIEPHKNGAAPQIKTQWLPLSIADENTVRKMWARVRLGLLAIKTDRRNGDTGNWTPQHIRMQLDMGFRGQSTAKLWVIRNRRGEELGFIITIHGNCPYLQVPQSLITWIAYTFRPLVRFGREGRAMGRLILEQLEQHARDMGLQYHDGYSNNIRWLKWLEWCGEGYGAAQIMFRKDVWRAE